MEKPIYHHHNYGFVNTVPFSHQRIRRDSGTEKCYNKGQAQPSAEMTQA